MGQATSATLGCSAMATLCNAVGPKGTFANSGSLINTGLPSSTYPDQGHRGKLQPIPAATEQGFCQIKNFFLIKFMCALSLFLEYKTA